MEIKLKNKKTILCSDPRTSRTEKSCNWCAKTIKPGKSYYYYILFYFLDGRGAPGEFCSPAHLKAASNAGL